jgi:siroheme synthase-like protein
MSVYPLALDGESLTAVVVGGGRVATRKVGGLLAAGAHVHVVAPEVSPELQALAGTEARLTLTLGTFEPAHIGDALLVVAATDDPSVNAEVARRARAAGRLVNVVDVPQLGNCVTPAVHRAGGVVVAVVAGGVPSAAVRIRDAIGKLLDQRYAAAVRDLMELRRSLLDDGRHERWTVAREMLIGERFCDDVESGEFSARVAEWR